MASTTDERLAALLDKQEITELLYRYCRGADRVDWELMRSCYHDDAIDDHGIFVATGVDELIEMCRRPLLGRFRKTMHLISNVLIELDGDRAVSECQAVGIHRMRDDGPPRDLVVHLRYCDRHERRDGGPWKIAHRTVVWEWAKVEPVEDYDLGPGITWGARAPEDLSYRLLDELRSGG